MRRTQLFALAGVCALVAAMGVWQFLWKPTIESSASSEQRSVDASSVVEPLINSAEKLSPFSVTQPETAESGVVTSTQDSLSLESAQSANDSDLNQNAIQSFEPVDVTTLGREELDDAAFEKLVAHIQADPQLLQQLIDELRQETDPVRLAALANLLGEVGGPEVTLSASELVFSGDPESRRIGLDLLQAIQPGNAEARDIATTLLATEVDPTVLVNTLTTLARPGAVDDSTRQFMSDQVAFLADHESEKVRSISLNILSRWSTDGQYTDVISNGLSDPATRVRKSAAYALVGHENVSQNLIDSLLVVAANTDENKRVRRGAILALKGMPISDYEREQLMAAELELNTIRR